MNKKLMVPKQRKYLSKLILCFLLLIPIIGNGQVFTEISDLAAPISGTGSSNIATIDNAWSIFVNPAGLSRLKSPEIISAFHKFYGMSFLSYKVAGIAIPVNKKIGSLALSYQSNSVDYSGNILSSEDVYSFSHALYLQKDIHSTLSIGYSVNLYHLDYGKSAGTEGDGSNGIDLGEGYGFGIDLGIQGSLRERTWIGFFAKNINSPEMGSALSSSALPRAIGIGFGYEPYYGLTTNFMIYQAFGNKSTQYRGGINYNLFPWISIRAGINTAPNTVNYGFSISKFGLKIDYAYINHPILPGTNQFSLGYTFNRNKK